MGKPQATIESPALSNSLVLTEAVDRRAAFLGPGALLDQAAFDKYSFMRDAFLANRQAQINGGAVSLTPEVAPAPQD